MNDYVIFPEVLYHMRYRTASALLIYFLFNLFKKEYTFFVWRYDINELIIIDVFNNEIVADAGIIIN